MDALAAGGELHRRNQVTCLPFSESGFIDWVHGYSGRAGNPNEQTSYLARFLHNNLSAHSLVVEEHYIDRNYTEEVAAYYARCFRQQRTWCARIHAFDSTVTDEILDAWMRRASTSRREMELVEEEICRLYLGFVVVRPIPSVPIGRTVLAIPRDEGRREFRTTVNYSVHLLGFKLRVEAVAFQQQDRAVAACATTAVWTALQRLCRHEGTRAPTTSSITDEAVRNSSHARVMPSAGLRLPQICDALRRFDFAPEVFKPGKQPDLFRLLLDIYLRSGIPVVLALRGDEGAHAVTAVGYEVQGASSSPRKPIIVQGSKGSNDSITALNLDSNKIYIHDDRLGPYARAELRIIPDDVPRLVATIEITSTRVDSLEVLDAVAPLYPKLRMSAVDLLNAGGTLTRLLRGARGARDGGEFELEMFFQRSGEYLSSLFGLVDIERLSRFQRNVTLSRYVGIVRCHAGSKEQLDVLWDTTDRLRGESYREQILGVVARSPSAVTFVDVIAEELGVLSG